MSDLERRRGNYDTAEALGRRSLAIWERRRTEKHPWFAGALLNMAELRLAQGRNDEAETFANRSLRMNEECGGPDQLPVAENLQVLANVMRATDRDADAVPLEARAASILKAYGIDPSTGLPSEDAVS